MTKYINTLIIIFILIASTSYADMFRGKPSDIKRWLNAKGCGGSYSDALRCYFEGLSNLSSGTLYDHINDVMNQHGYTGTLGDKLGAFFTAKTGVSDRRDAERSFWDNDSLNFSPQQPEQVVFASENVVFAGENVFFP